MRFLALAAGIAALAVGSAVAAGPCEDVAISIAGPEPPGIGALAIADAQSWEAASGGKASLVTYPMAELYPALLLPLGTGRGGVDVMLHALPWLGDLAPFLAEMPASLRRAPAFADIFPVYRERLMVWDGRVLAQILTADVALLAYRRDLFDDSAERAAFAERYGHRLRPPTTWREYYDIAEFFTRPEPGFSGTAEPMAPGERFRLLVAHAAGYSADREGAFLFDPGTMTPRIAGPAWRRGLDEVLRSLALAPAEAAGWSRAERRAAFAAGDLAMAIDIGGIVGLTMAEGAVGFSPLPAADEVWSPERERWERRGRPMPVPYLGAGAWLASVPAGSTTQGCAWDFVAWLTKPERALADALAGAGAPPYRRSALGDARPWAGRGDPAAAESYLAAIRSMLEAPRPLLEPRITGWDLYVGAAEIEITRALMGELEPQAALEAIARAWEELTEGLGRAGQLALYRASLGLPPQAP